MNTLNNGFANSGIINNGFTSEEMTMTSIHSGSELIEGTNISYADGAAMLKDYQRDLRLERVLSDKSGKTSSNRNTRDRRSAFSGDHGSAGHADVAARLLPNLHADTVIDLSGTGWSEEDAVEMAIEAASEARFGRTALYQ